MKSNFLKVKGFLEGQFPELQGKITGGNYPKPPLLELATSIVSMLQLVAMAWIVFGGETLFRFIGFSQPPAIFYTIQQYGMQIGIGIFFLVPQIMGGFATNGAFEVIVDGETVIWSKLAEGRFPSADEMTNPLVKMGLALAQAS